MSVKPLSFACCACLAALIFARSAHAEPTQAFIEKPVGAGLVKMPVLPNFAKACDESQQLAERAAALTPKTSEFITCFVPASKWRDFQAGRATDLYPLIGVAVARPPASGVTPDEFKKIVEAARKQLGDLLANGGAAKRLAEQDAALARGGHDFQRRNFKQAYGGLFPTPQDIPNFAYLTARTADLAENGVASQVKEVVATGVVLHGGRLISLSVVDGASPDAELSPVQNITREWIRAFASLN
ncbi:hypothetical protein [Variovorax sp. IB41]|uniref:hypothetical protein n=1 Tax=Variovorax sp. IB41 TaxID=2779370 RepID=UPI0018E8BFC3|nr:hypothetical protein [Variovorax sp. IB41]MBJ2158725.1 hypothetical protein [Variovorax sp. IB41]